MSRRALIIAVITGLLASVLLWFYLTSIEEKYRESSKSYPVLVAKGYIIQGAIIKDRMVQIAKVPRQYIQPGSLKSIDELIDEKGQYLYTNLLPILENEQITLSKLSNIRQQMGLSVVIPEGKIAVPVPATPMTTLGGYIRPGNIVNILCTFDYEERGKYRTSTVTLFQNVLVLSVGEKMIGSPSKITDTKASQEQENSEASVITIALTPQEASILTFALEKGKITFTLKPAGDDSVENIKPTKIEDIIPGAEQRAGGSSVKEQLQLQYLQQFINKK
jgi:pilus assembly protein CpaB